MNKNKVQYDGYEPSMFLKKPSEKFSCPICLNVLRDPRLCSNGHSFCFSCVEAWSLKNSSCPICQVDLELSKMVRNLTLREIIDEKETFCPTCDLNGRSNECCQWTGELQHREQHVETVCGFFSIDCPNLGCELQFERRFLGNHLTECPFKPAPCENVQSLEPILKEQELQVRALDEPDSVADAMNFDPIVENIDNKSKARKAKSEKVKSLKPLQEGLLKNVFKPTPLVSVEDCVKEIENEISTLRRNGACLSALTSTNIVNWIRDHHVSHASTALWKDLRFDGDFGKLGSMESPGKAVIAHEFAWKELLGLQAGQELSSPIAIYCDVRKGVKVHLCFVIRRDEKMQFQIQVKLVKKAQGGGGVEKKRHLLCSYLIYSPFENVTSISEYIAVNAVQNRVIPHSEKVLCNFVKNKVIRVAVVCLVGQLL